MLTKVLTKEQAQDIKRRNQRVRDWLTTHKTNCYKREELEKELGESIPTHEEISALEVYEFVADPPERYFLYVKAPRIACKGGIGSAEDVHYGGSGLATTWTGEKLGDVQFGRTWRSVFGDTRVSVSVYGINGKTYHGTYYKSAGDYARVKMSKR